ncbi:MAG: hypothetical protein ACE5M4_12825 [Anaerolineales bacterium]
MKINRRSELGKKARRGFRGYPVATMAFYGPTDELATKVAVGIVLAEGAEPSEMQRWYSEEQDVRVDPEILEEMVAFVERYEARSVVMTDRIIGCPHEEGIDYPEGKPCPQCPFWAGRDRRTGEYVH